MKGEVINRSSRMASVRLFCEKQEEGVHHCGACSMGQEPEKFEIVNAHNDVGATVGEVVECTLEETGRLKAAIILLLVPLVLFLTVAGTLTSMKYSLPVVFFVSLSVMGLVLFVLKLILSGKTYYHIVGRKGAV